MVIYMANPNKFFKNLLEVLTEVSKVAGYKNTKKKKKSMSFLYTNNEHFKIKILISILFIIVPKKMTCIGINLTKYVQNLHAEIMKF